jgi:hypothetical protein
MTPAAITNREQNTWVVKRKIASVYNNANFDVEWKESNEPRSVFLDEKGQPLPAYTNFIASNKTRRPRAASALAALAFFTVLIPTTLPDYLETHYDSPYTFNDSGMSPRPLPVSRTTDSPAYSATNASAFLAKNASQDAYWLDTSHAK